MLFTYDVVLIDETHNGINVKLEVLRQTRETKRFKLCRTNTEYIKCKFNEPMHEEGMEVRLDTKYLQMRQIQVLYIYN